MTIKSLIQKISKKEWIFISIIAVVLIVLTTAPYIYGHLNAPKDSYFLFMSGMNRVDYSNYFSYIEQAKQGNLLFEDFFTTEQQPRIIFNLFFLILGFFAKIFSLSGIQIFHILRIILIPIFLFVIYIFLILLFKKPQARKICLFLICFSSGISVWTLKYITTIPDATTMDWPMDLWVPEAITFLTLYTNTLFIFSTILIILIFTLLLVGFENKNYKYAVLAGITGLILFQTHPYHFPTVFLILGIYWILLFIKQKHIDWIFFKHCVIFSIICLPSLIYYYWLSSTHWLTIHRIAQAIPAGHTPGFYALMSTYGLLWPLLIIGIYCFRKNKYFIFLITWLLAQLFLIYSPLPLQRRMAQGLHIIVSIFATGGLLFLYNKTKKSIILNNKILWIIIFIFGFTLSNIYVVLRDISWFKHEFFSAPKNNINAMEWIKNNTSKQSNILGHYKPSISNIIPVFAMRKVYAGHGIETIDAKTKYKQIDWFLNNNKYDLNKYEFLKNNKINYLFFEKLKNTENKYNPDEKKYLEKVFENKTINIYKIL